MKLKGINPIEQHIEKIVLAIAAVGLLAVTAMQFVFSPNEVEVGRTTVGPANVYLALGRQADDLLGELQDPSPALPELNTPELASRLPEPGDRRSLLEGAVTGVALGPGASVEIEASSVATGPLMAARVPTPTEAVAATYWGAVDPYFVEAFPQIQEFLLRQRQPYDLPAVSVEASLNGLQLAELLSGSEDGRRSIPSRWWRDGMAVIDVQVERQSKAPTESDWSSAEPIAGAFWVPSLLSQAGVEASGLDDASITPANLSSIVQAAQSDVGLVARPEFVPTIAGRFWERPSEIPEAAEDLTRFQDIEQTRRDIESREERLARLTENDDGRPTPRRSEPSSSPGRRPPPGGGGRDPGGSDPQRQTNEPVDRRQQQIDELETELETLRTRLDELTAPERASGAYDPAASGSRRAGRTRRSVTDPYASPGRTPPPTSNVSSSPSGLPQALLSSDSFSVWAHDVAVSPGLSYRYRVRVGVNSPLYGRTRLVGDDAPDEVRAQAASAVVYSDWSDWTEPVEVDRAEYFFVTSASEGGGVAGDVGGGTPIATAEVFSMYYGHYRRSEVRLRPGEPVVGEVTWPEGVELYEFDTATVTPEGITDLFRAREQARNPRRERRTSTRDPQPTDPGRTPRSGRNDDQTAASEEEETLPAGITRVNDQLVVQIDTLLLDVVDFDDAGLRRGEREVVLFDPLRGMVTRSVQTDVEQPSYARMSVSAFLAESGRLREPQAIERP